MALAPPLMFSRHIDNGSIVQPFDVYTSRGNDWLTRLKSQIPTPAMNAFSARLRQKALSPSNSPI